MHRSAAPMLPLLIVALLLAACEGGPPWGAREEQQPAMDRDVFGPTAAYDRRFIFLGPGAELPTALIFDFAAVGDSAALRRGIRARLVDGIEWVPLMDAGWEMAPMREPWRLVPHGPLRVLVGDQGELDALVLRGEPDVRLETGSTIAEYSPDAGTQLVLRQGRLRLGDEPLAGILLDAQLARAVSPSAPAAAPAGADTTTTADGGGAAAAQDTAEEEPAEPPDTAVSPVPAPRPGTEALLVDNSGFYVVFATSAEGAMAWLHSGGRDDVRRGARLEPTAREIFPEASVEVPTAWRVVSGAAPLAGELRAEAADRSMLDGGAGAGVLGYVVVTGWIEDRGVRRNVYGLLRHVR